VKIVQKVDYIIVILNTFNLYKPELVQVVLVQQVSRDPVCSKTTQRVTLNANEDGLRQTIVVCELKHSVTG